MQTNSNWEIQKGALPLVATAIHHGHGIRPDLAGLIRLAEADRLREEDPYTGEWTVVAPNRITVFMSRFEVDLNRARERAVYRKPEDCWGLKLWKGTLPQEALNDSLALYDDFYKQLATLLEKLKKQYGVFAVFDIHSYNHRRGGPKAPPDDPAQNPDINVGTRTLNRARWGALVERFMKDLRACRFKGKALDVRENVKFRGGYMSEWIHKEFPYSACVLALEFKKIFMDEWTGKPDPAAIQELAAVLKTTVPGVLEELETVCEKK